MTSRKKFEDANRELKEAWREQIVSKIQTLEKEITARFATIEEEVARLHEEVATLSQSIKGLIEP